MQKQIKPYLYPTSTYPYELPKLPFNYNELEPYIDAMTMEIHHSRHHQTYVTNFNNAIKDHPELHKIPMEELLMTTSKLQEPLKSQVENFGGGTKNHNFYFDLIGPKGSREPVGEVKKQIDATFGSFDAFKDKFSAEAAKFFGSGWTWLSLDQNNKVVITSTLNQFTPMQQGLRPIFTIDVWEHAYYLKHKNKRVDYIKDYFNVVNWDKVEDVYHKALKALQ